MKFFSKITSITKRFFKSTFNISLKLGKPVDEFKYEKKKNLLLGTWYEKTLQVYDKQISIKSPINGVINRVYSNNSIFIKNEDNIQILILIFSDYKGDYLKLEKEKGKKLKKGDILLVVKKPEGLKNDSLVINLSVIVPWQYKLIKKIQNEKIFYKNPLVKAKIMNVYGYY
jgi:phosphotransferase system IIA component